MEDETPAAKRAKSSVGSAKESKPGLSSSNAADKSDVKRKVARKVSPALKITDLNEQCQLEILQRLNLAELCAMAEVCIPMKEVAQNFFSVKHRNVDLSELITTENGKYSLTKVRQLLYNFGHLISVLTIDIGKLDDRDNLPKMFTLIRKYCIETLDKMVFTSQPNERVGEYIMISFLGTELMMRNVPAGRYVTRSSLEFKPGGSTQVQNLVAK